MSRLSHLRQLGHELLELVFPPACAVCDSLGREVICASCREQFEFVEPPYCMRCGKPLPESAAQTTICGQCRQQSPRFDAARSVGLHTTTLREAVLRFKFTRRRQLAEPQAELLAQRVRREMSCPGSLPWTGLTGIVPVVLHPRRRGWRGFDQALLLSRHLGALIDVPCLEHVLIRNRDTAPQIGLTPPQRRQNVHGAFEVVDADVIGGARLLLIDDVYTTGSTLNEAARILKKAGAEAVYALTLTRALPTWHPQGGRRLGDEDDLP